MCWNILVSAIKMLSDSDPLEWAPAPPSEKPLIVLSDDCDKNLATKAAAVPICSKPKLERQVASCFDSMKIQAPYSTTEYPSSGESVGASKDVYDDYLGSGASIEPEMYCTHIDSGESVDSTFDIYSGLSFRKSVPLKYSGLETW